MTTGGLLVIVGTLGFTLAAWFLAMFTRHQVKAHIAARDSGAAPAATSASKPGTAFDVHVNGSSIAGARIYSTSFTPAGQAVVGSTKRSGRTIVDEG